MDRSLWVPACKKLVIRVQAVGRTTYIAAAEAEMAAAGSQSSAQAACVFAIGIGVPAARLALQKTVRPTRRSATVGWPNAQR